MTRRDLHGRRAVLLAALFLIVGATAPAMAGATMAGDDRPPLLAAEPAPAGNPSASRLVDYSIIPGVAGVELVLRGNGGLPYQVFALTAPDRLVFDLPGVVADVDRRRAEVGANGLVRVRVGQYRETPEPIARVVLELDHPLAYQISRDNQALHVRLAELSASVAPNQPLATAETTAKSAEIARPAPAPIAAAENPALPGEPLPAVATTTANDGSPLSPPRTASATLPAAPPTPADVAPKAELNPAPAPTEAPTAGPTSSPGANSVLAPAATAAPEAPPAAPEAPVAPSPAASTVVNLPNAETKTIQDQRRVYSGQPVSLNLMDADIRHVFSVFHELSGLNFVLDPAVSGTVTIVVDEVPWDQALDLILQNNGLEMMVEGNVVRIAPVQKLAQEASARRNLREAKELEANPVTITRTLSYSKATDVDKVVREAILSPKGRVIVDDRTNTLIIRDIPDRVEAIDKLLTTLDAETPQVMIEARLVQVSRDFVRDLGIKWGMTGSLDAAHGTQTNLQFPHRADMSYDLNLPRNPGVNALSFSFGNVLDSFTLDITLDALENEGYAKQLSAPKVATQNNESAEIEQGVRFPIVKTTATEIQTEFVSASLRMKVTPQITADGTVILEIEVNNDQPDFVNSVAGIPSITTQRAKTKVLIGDGGTTVIGGIFTVTEGRSEVGVPFFRKLPGLGWLFRSKKIESHNRELLIFITPRIVKAS